VPDFLSALSLSSILGFAAGVGYCALVRAPLIEHNFDFTQDYKFANPKFRDQRNGVKCLVLTSPSQNRRNRRSQGRGGRLTLGRSLSVRIL
jgi:hypothetical protein